MSTNITNIREISVQIRAYSRNMTKGFTLIEILIYAALIAMMIGGALVAVFQLMESSDKIQSKILVEEEANFLLRKIAWALSGVSAINSPAAGSSGSTLSINKTNFSQNPVVFDLNSSNARISRSGGSAVILNSQNVTIQTLNFEHVAASGNAPEAIKVSLTVNTRPFSTTVYLRK